MGAFRKRSNLSGYSPSGSSGSYKVTVHRQKKVTTPDNPEPTVYIETAIESVEDYAKSLGLPKDENYQLRDMLATGRIPEAVDVRGMLDSQDPTDLANVGVPDALLSRLSAFEKPAPASAPAPASEPAPVEPSNN